MKQRINLKKEHICKNNIESEEEDDMCLPLSEIMKGPLCKAFYIGLLSLEAKISTKLNYSFQQVLDLVQMYGRCVEYFDTHHDPVKWYFIEKIQNTLSESSTRISNIFIKNIDELILKKEKEFIREQEVQNKIKPIILQTNISHNPLARSTPNSNKGSTSGKKTNSMKETPKTMRFTTEYSTTLEAEKDQITDKEQQKRKMISLNQIREIRTKKLNIIEEVHKGKEQLCQGELLDEWNNDVNLNDKIIKSQLNDQSSTINQRLEKRKQTLKQIPKQNYSMTILKQLDEGSLDILSSQQIEPQQNEEFQAQFE